MNGTTTETHSTWQDVANRKRQRQAALIDAFLANEGNESNGNGEIPVCSPIAPETDVLDLVEVLASQELQCKQTTREFIRRACEAHKSDNCLTEVVFDEALGHAAELDEYVAKHGKLVGPLHGVPVTLKDQFDIAGVDSTLGYVGRSFKPAADDAVLVKMLRSLGAVILGKSNLPQSIMWCETENPLWGLTTNPRSKKYTPGGSTGGEAVLLSAGASLLGWGTDIGGSIRIPSHMMGIYGFKPSSARLPYRGVPVSTEGQEHVPSSIGPMARSLSTIRLAMESIIRAKPWDFDVRCAPIPWRADVVQDTLSRPLVIGVLYDDEVVRPHPPITRVLKSAVEALRAAGHEVFEWNPKLHAECIEVMDQFYTVDGGEDIRRDVLAAGEPYIPHVERLLKRGQAISVYEYWQLNRRKWDLQQAYLEKWKSLVSPESGRPADVLLLPPMPHAAVPHGGCRWVGYTKVWNLLDYPALVLPGGTVSQEDVAQDFDFEPRGEIDEWNKKIWMDNREEMASLGLPVGVQLVCRKLEEEKLLAAGAVLDALLPKKK